MLFRSVQIHKFASPHNIKTAKVSCNPAPSFFDFDLQALFQKVQSKVDGLNLSSRPRKGNVHTRPPLLCRVALSYVSVAPTSSSKRRLDQLPSRCSIALVEIRVKIPESFTPESPSIHYLLKHCLPAPARYPPFTCMQINQAIMLVVLRILH